jgi:hypothetical protein
VDRFKWQSEPRILRSSTWAGQETRDGIAAKYNNSAISCRVVIVVVGWCHASSLVAIRVGILDTEWLGGEWDEARGIWRGIRCQRHNFLQHRRCGGEVMIWVRFNANQ